MLNRSNRLTASLFVISILTTNLFSQAPKTQPSFDGDDLLAAAQAQDIEKVKAILSSGVDVNSQSKYGATPLYFAADRGNAELAKVLLKAGADPNLKDRFYNGTPLWFAQMRDHHDVVKCLFEYGATHPDSYFFAAISTNKIEAAEAILASGKVSGQSLARAKEMVDKKNSESWQGFFSKTQIPEIQVYKPTSLELENWSGTYSAFGTQVNVAVEDEKLKLGFNGLGGSVLNPVSKGKFLMGENLVAFSGSEERSDAVTMSMSGNTFTLSRIEASDEPKSNSEENNSTEKTEFAFDTASSIEADRAVSSSNWPMFRGVGSRGVAQGQKPPVEWNVEENKNIKWKIGVEGLGLSCPAIWEEYIFLTSAVSENDSGELRTGLYGDVDSVQDDSNYDFNVYCINKSDGSIKWQKNAHRGKPAVKRHAKSSHANSTIAVDGKHVVAFFASEGLYCYSFDGELIWKKDLGFLDSGWFYDADYQWGFASSPIIFKDQVIVQCDIQGDSFIASYALEDGKEKWRTARDEIPSWSSPIVHEFDDLPMLITYGTKAARGYDARDGQLLWELKGQHSEIVVPTPFVAHDLIFVCSGYSPIRPIYAIKSSARGDITLNEGEESNDHVAWMKPRGGPYLPTPVVYGDYLYTCDNSGILTCYKATTGEQAYRKRMNTAGGRLSFSASVLAADGHLYFSAEDGRVLVVKAGPKYELIATNPTGENVLATPAISEGVFYLRTQNSLVAVHQSDASPKQQVDQPND